MANISGSYDQNATPNEFPRITPGTHRAKIIESDIVEISETKDVGRCLKLTWQIETGPMDGQLIWQRLNMWWTGPEKKLGTVVQIANAQFAEVRQACGKVAPQDSSELHHIPCMITVGPQKNDDRYDEIKSVKPVGGGVAANQQQSRPAPPVSNRAPAASNGGSAPWRKTG